MIAKKGSENRDYIVVVALSLLCILLSLGFRPLGGLTFLNKAAKAREEPPEVVVLHLEQGQLIVGQGKLVDLALSCPLLSAPGAD